jgi:pimeloyl-ACP methyl ester carboxylesterase
MWARPNGYYPGSARWRPGWRAPRSPRCDPPRPPPRPVDGSRHGYDFDTLADDLATVLDRLAVHDVTLVGHSMGGGAVARYLARHGTRRIARVLLTSSPRGPV